LKRLVGLAIAALLIAGCATNAPQHLRPPQQSSAPRPRPLPGTVSPATYVAQAASIDLFVIKSSELALSRSANEAIRDAARRLIAAHQGTASQLSFAGRRLNLLPSAALLPQHQAMLDELGASSDFGRTYIRLQRSIHGQALALHSDYARRGTSPTLRPVAANAAAVEQADVGMLRQIG
jgi:predicted outer membrane protein